MKRLAGPGRGLRGALSCRVSAPFDGVGAPTFGEVQG
jgi:hypothetical protein